MVRSLEGKHPKYYEAVLQLRDVTQKTVDIVEDELARGRLRCIKVVEIRTGVDYFMSDNTLTLQLGKKLQKKMGGELSTTASLHTHKNNKDLYRVTVLFRQTHFRKGDEVEYHGEPYTVKGMAKDIFLQHQKTGKKVHVRYKDMKSIKKKE